MADTKRPKDRTQPFNSPSVPPSPRPAEGSDSWEQEHVERTVRMGAPAKSTTLMTEIPRHAPVPRAAGRSVELFVLDETSLPGGERRPWRAAEVWTKRRVYGLDSTFKCVEVLDRETGRLELRHDMIGARLGGGRLREKEMVRFSYPLPLPGMEAMFLKGKKHGYTSPIERMIVRIRVLHTSADEVLPTWEEIASRWSEPPPK